MRKTLKIISGFFKDSYFAILISGIILSCNHNKAKYSDEAKLITQKMADGSTKVIGAMINGKKEGLWIVLNESGKLSSQEIFIHNNIVGETINYFEDGKTILETGYLSNGQRNGQWISFYYNHKISEKGYYVNGHRDGVWEYYLNDGRLNKKMVFDGKNQKIILDNHLLPPTPADEKDVLPKIDTNNRAIVK